MNKFFLRSFINIQKNESLFSKFIENFSSKNFEKIEFMQRRKWVKKQKISDNTMKDTKTIMKKYFDKVNDPSLQIEDLRVQDIYKKMDSTIEGFFFKREITLKNFNFLLQILAEQKKLDDAEQAYQKMLDLNIQPNLLTYNFLIKAAAKQFNPQIAEKYFKISQQKFGKQLQLYSSLMNCYARIRDSQKCFELFKELKDSGLNPDNAVYTTLINSFYKDKKLDKCWEFYYECAENIEPDQYLQTLMIEICAHSHDAEKALSFWNMVQENDYHHSCIPYNALIKALGSRTDYAQQGIQEFHKMIANNIKPDYDTFIHLLKACSSIGDVKTAYDAIIMFRDQGFQMNKYIYNGMLRTYARSVTLDYLDKETREMYVADSWKLFDQIVKEKQVSTHILNSLLLVHTLALKSDQVEGMVLPLYSQLNLKKDQFTEENILEMYHNQQDLEMIFKVYQIFRQKEQIVPTFKSMNIVLESAIKIQNVQIIVDLLKEFKKLGKTPKIPSLKRLGEAENLPDEIYLELLDFEPKFGFVKDNVKRYQKPDKFLTM